VNWLVAQALPNWLAGGAGVGGSDPSTPPVNDMIPSMGTALSIAALIASIASLTLASMIALRQVRVSRNANQLPIIVDIVYKARSIQFRKMEERLQRELPAYDGSQGFGILPEDLADQAMEICIYYQNLAYLMVLKIIDPLIVYLPFHVLMPLSWDALEPYILAQRKAQGTPYGFMNQFEYMVKHVRGMDLETLTRKLAQQTFGVG
jgi:hypothetical protein